MWGCSVCDTLQPYIDYSKQIGFKKPKFGY